MSNDLVITDRYKALGIPYPDPDMMCKGDCEGTGWVPINNPEFRLPCGAVFAVASGHLEEKYAELWNAAHESAGKHECDGWHFLKCPDCDGSGRAKKE